MKRRHAACFGVLLVAGSLLLSGCAHRGEAWDLVSVLGGSSTPPPEADGTTAHPYPAEPSTEQADSYGASWVALPDGRSVLCVRIKSRGSVGSPSVSCDFEHVRDVGLK